MPSATKPNETQAPANAQHSAEIQAELTAQQDAISALMKTSGAIGALGREKLAIELGKSATKAGRPSFGAWQAFVMAIVASKASYAEQNRLCGIANKNVNVEFVKANGERVTVAKMTAKGEVGKGTCSYRVNTPVSWAIAVGE